MNAEERAEKILRDLNPYRDSDDLYFEAHRVKVKAAIAEAIRQAIADELESILKQIEIHMGLFEPGRPAWAICKSIETYVRSRDQK